MTYSQNMAIRFALFAIPAVVAVALVRLLNSVNASPGIAVAAYTVVAVTIGFAIGWNADRLPGIRPSETTRAVSHRRDS
jgi:hypothetical protein